MAIPTEINEFLIVDPTQRLDVLTVQGSPAELTRCTITSNRGGLKRNSNSSSHISIVRLCCFNDTSLHILRCVIRASDIFKKKQQAGNPTCFIP